LAGTDNAGRNSGPVVSTEERLMMPGKYIVLDRYHIVIFDPAMNHNEVAAGFRGKEVTSAGSIAVGAAALGEPVVTCFGRSMSLGIGSDPLSDEILAKNALGIFDDF